jgi:hypothetical protein
MARVPEVARNNFFLVRGIYCCPIFSQPILLYYEVCVCVCVCVYMYIYTYMYIYIYIYTLSTILITTKWCCKGLIFYINQNLWDVIGCLNRLPKYAFNYFVPSLPSTIFTITVIIFNCNIYLNNYDGRPQDSILLLKIPMATWKILSEDCQQFGNTLSESFASPCLVRLMPLYGWLSMNAVRCSTCVFIRLLPWI